MRQAARAHTENRFICWLIWWFHESHAPWPKRVIRVYSFREYFCASSHHIWVEDYNFWRTLYRAVGMIFVRLKKSWDRGEAKLSAYSRTNGARIRLIRNGTVSPAVWSDVSTQNSMVEWTASATSVTGGETVYTAFCDQEGGVAFPLSADSLGRMLGAYSHLLPVNPADTFVITAASVNATANIQVGINWKEIR